VSESIWPTIHAERRALADDLADLTPEQWAMPSLCDGWTIHDVLAHQLSAEKMTPPKFFKNMVAARFDFGRFAGKQVEIEGAGGPAATLAAFRAESGRTNAPPGPKDTWLGEAFVHGEDIRRPLGIKRDYPLDQVARALAFYAKSQAVIHSRKRIAGLTLKATDTEYQVGTGPVVEGPVMSLLMAAGGRKAALGDLTGPGLEILAKRL